MLLPSTRAATTAAHFAFVSLFILTIMLERYRIVKPLNGQYVSLRETHRILAESAVVRSILAPWVGQDDDFAKICEYRAPHWATSRTDGNYLA
jgi:hypothetical protein